MGALSRTLIYMYFISEIVVLALCRIILAVNCVLFICHIVSLSTTSETRVVLRFVLWLIARLESSCFSASWPATDTRLASNTTFIHQN